MPIDSAEKWPYYVLIETNNAPEGKMMNKPATFTYHVEFFKAGQYEETKVSFIVEAIGHHSASVDTRKAGSFDHLGAGRTVKVSGKKAAELIAAGAKDLREPRVATTENRKRLGALVGM